eukprot:8928826-Pyramimonas_sp.AAC.1
MEVRPHLTDIEGIALTGPGLLGADVCLGDGGEERGRRMYTQLRIKVEARMMEECLIASNTFREREITWYGYRAGPQAAGKFLDYVLVSRGTTFAQASVSWPRELGSTR